MYTLVYYNTLDVYIPIYYIMCPDVLPVACACARDSSMAGVMPPPPTSTSSSARQVCVRVSVQVCVRVCVRVCK